MTKECRPSFDMKPDGLPESGTQEDDRPDAEANASEHAVCFSVARVLLTLSVSCPVMVLVLTAYDYRVKYVLLAKAILIIAPLMGIWAFHALPGRPRTKGTEFVVFAALTFIYVVLYAMSSGVA